MEPYAKLEENQEDAILSLPSTTQSPNGTDNIVGNKVRLRAVETESEFFLKLMHISLLKKLITVQGALSVLIVLIQIILYSSTRAREWKAIDYSGISLWGPLFFFSVAVGLSFMSTKGPTGCVLGTALAFQVVTVIIGSIIVLLATISIAMHGYYYRNPDNDDYLYNAEVFGIILCSSMVICAMVVVITAFFISIQFCKATCCGRFHTAQYLLFDVESCKT